MRDEKGFSLIELIVTVALMAVIMAVVVIGMGAMTGMHARECAKDLDAALDQEKNYALTKSGSVDCYMELKKEADGFYVEFYVPDKPVAKPEDITYILIDRKKIGKASVSIVCTFEGGATQEIDESRSVKFYFNRVSGAFKECEYGASKAFCREIRVTKNRVYLLSLVPATGKHTMVRES